MNIFKTVLLTYIISLKYSYEFRQHEKTSPFSMVCANNKAVRPLTSKLISNSIENQVPYPKCPQALTMCCDEDWNDIEYNKREGDQSLNLEAAKLYNESIKFIKENKKIFAEILEKERDSKIPNSKETVDLVQISNHVNYPMNILQELENNIKLFLDLKLTHIPNFACFVCDVRFKQIGDLVRSQRPTMLDYLTFNSVLNELNLYLNYGLILRYSIAFRDVTDFIKYTEDKLDSSKTDEYQKLSANLEYIKLCQLKTESDFKADKKCMNLMEEAFKLNSDINRISTMKYITFIAELIKTEISNKSAVIVDELNQSELNKKEVDDGHQIIDHAIEQTTEDLQEPVSSIEVKKTLKTPLALISKPSENKNAENNQSQSNVDDKLQNKLGLIGDRVKTVDAEANEDGIASYKTAAVFGIVFIVLMAFFLITLSK